MSQKTNPEQKTNGLSNSSESCEVVPKKKRRRLTAAYKLRILEEADKCTEPGEVGALLRREGLFSSSLTQWRRLRDKGTLQALKSHKPAATSDSDQELRKQIRKLRRQNESLEKRLKKSEIVIDVQKKLSELLGLSGPNSNS
jgi:transposase-like protein